MMAKVSLFILLISFAGFLLAEDEINKVLDRFHQAAADANYDQYFDLLADNAIFIGTDSTERWTKQEFSQYVKPFFSKGKGWLYTTTARNISYTQGDSVVFFDELLWNQAYGQCRGVGVLKKLGDQWKILQYSLSIPIPNSRAKSIVDIIQQSSK